MVWNDRTKTGAIILVSLVAGLSYLWLAVLVGLVGVFLVLWGQDPKRTEEFIGGLPGGVRLVKLLSQIDEALPSKGR